MTRSCAICGNTDWLGVGVCADCSGQQDRQLVFVAPQPTAMGRADVVRHLREFLNAPRVHADLSEAARGRKPLAIVPSALSAAALRSLDAAGVQGRVVPYRAWPRALPMSFALMTALVLLIGMLAGTRALPMLVWASPVVALLLLSGAAYQLTRPLIPMQHSPSVLPPTVRALLADALVSLKKGQVRSLLLDIARVGESSFAALSPAFRAAPLGQSVLELLTEAGPLATETAQLENIAYELAPRVGPAAAAEFERLSEAVTARVQLLEHVIALLGRIAREGADSLEEASALVQRVRAEAAYRVGAETIVAKVLEAAPLS